MWISSVAEGPGCCAALSDPSWLRRGWVQDWVQALGAATRGPKGIPSPFPHAMSTSSRGLSGCAPRSIRGPDYVQSHQLGVKRKLDDKDRSPNALCRQVSAPAIVIGRTRIFPAWRMLDWLKRYWPALILAVLGIAVLDGMISSLVTCHPQITEHTNQPVSTQTSHECTALMDLCY